MALRREAEKIWLHHAEKESVVVILNSKEYKDMLKDGGFRKTITEILIDREFLEKEKEDIKISLDRLDRNISDKDLEELFICCKDELVKRGLFSQKDGNKEDAK